MLFSAALASLGLSFTFALGGVGAAAALIPVLHSMGMALSMARPLGLLINTLSLSSASYVNIKNGNIRVQDWVPLIGASLCGAPIGAYASTKIPEEILLQAFAAFLAIAGLVMRIGIRKIGEKEKMSPLTQLFWGAVSGLISGLLGVGSGGIVVPILGLMNFQAKRIASITALVVPVSSFSGFLAYLQMGDVTFSVAAICGSMAVIGGYLGTKVMHRCFSQTIVRKFLAFVMLFLAGKILFNSLS